MPLVIRCGLYESKNKPLRKDVSDRKIYLEISCHTTRYRIPYDVTEVLGEHDGKQK